MSANSNLPASINRFGSQSLDRVTRSIQRETSQEIARTVGQGLVTNTREEIRAAITSTALQNVGALSALEQHLIEVAPMGAYVIVVTEIVLVFLLASLLVDHAAQWLNRQSYQRAQKIERELAKTERALALMGLAQASLLDAHAHEAAVALILESYRASKETGDDVL
jgi:hypothetical protein